MRPDIGRRWRVGVLPAVVALSLLAPGCGTEPEGDAEIANPSAVFCEEQGGTYSLDDETCTLTDGSVVDAWDYYRELGSDG
jgi:putative hemolysin